MPLERRAWPDMPMAPLPVARSGRFAYESGIRRLTLVSIHDQPMSTYPRRFPASWRHPPLDSGPSGNELARSGMSMVWLGPPPFVVSFSDAKEQSCVAEVRHVTYAHVPPRAGKTNTLQWR